MDGTAILERLGGSRNILLLQGPVGPFFDHLARFLVEQGRFVSKINLNAGDAWFYRQPGSIDYSEQPDHWPHFVDRVLVERKIDAIVLFGDCRPYHRSAILRARMKAVPVFVFEEGYIRPNFVTFEPNGVNANSMLPCSDADLRLVPLPEKVKKKRTRFSRMARYAFMYYLAGRLGRRQYPNYRHHKPFDLYPEGLYWLRSGMRKLIYRFTERSLGARLTNDLAGKYFLVPLQVFNDSQIRSHSDFRSVRAMIGTVLESFAREAPPDAHLVFKHHPMDRGHRHYGRQIVQTAAASGVGGRVHYVHDLHLPTLLKNARGAVLVNSTTGVSAMFHDKPVKTLGRCLYDLPGLTHQGELASFWQNPAGPDRDLYERFRNYLIRMTQVRGSFYSGGRVVLGNERPTLRLVATDPALGTLASSAPSVAPSAPPLESAVLRTGT
ncbi:capsule biosynthesis protein [Aromatoleum sp.]|uniref:capsule biosynthesis protein n=1 Tax=Aromatoleum sp. TaxID=2307007 RepID=UPI002FC5B2C3